MADFNATNITNITTEASTIIASTSSTSKTEVTMKVIISVIGTLGIVGNLIVCFVILKDRFLRTLTNIFIFNQSLIDLTSSILLLVLNLGPTKKTVVVPMGVAGDILCKIWLSRYFMWASFNVSTFNLVALTLERYVAIVYPVVHHNRFTATKARRICVIVWIMGLVYQSYWAKANYNRNDGSCGVEYPEGAMQKALGMMAFIVEYFFPLAIMSFGYMRMFLVLKRRTTKIRSAATTSGNGSSTQEENPSFVKARNNVIKMLCIVSLTYALCWAPNQIMYIEYNMLGVHHTEVVRDTTVVIAFLNMCVNPMIYALKYRQFQEAIKKLICRQYGNNVENSGLSNSSRNTTNHQGTVSTKFITSQRISEDGNTSGVGKTQHGAPTGSDKI
ncbi:allatostatin-A receptor-like [Saccoglossus kowalevskii]|uniref:Allatostatin-A receptor-like n=1 Tax=Saccoglossus kowalevskii TaxID=10224 RepID=A0ABM0MRI5_SACKO|nr:PREDICTED: allatostatin-A receptor-like [Saccoglossus kowalevskii]